MKKKIPLILSILLCLICLAGLCCAQESESEDEKSDDFLQSSAEIFIRTAYVQDFSEDQGYTNEFPNPATLHQYYVYDGVGTDLLMSLFPAEESVLKTNKRIAQKKARREEFHVSFSVRKSEDVPEGEGGRCWIRYGNLDQRAIGRGKGVIIYPGGSAYFFDSNNSIMTTTKIADLFELDPTEWIKFDILRLNKVVYVYANETLMFSYEDGIEGAVSFDGGSELYVGGTRIRCDFDDFIMRTK